MMQEEFEREYGWLAKYEEGLKHLKKRAYAEAIKPFKEAAENFTYPAAARANAWYKCGRAYDHLGEYAKAIEAYHKAIAIKDYPIEAYHKALAKKQKALAKKA